MLSILDLKPPDEKPVPALNANPAPPEPIDAARTDFTNPAQIMHRAPVQTAPVQAAPSPVAHAEPPAPLQSTPAPMKKTVRPLLRTVEVPVSEPVNIPDEPAAAPPEPADGKDEPGEYELVLGRRQIASWLFVGTLVIAVFSAASYYIGRMSVPSAFADMDGKSAPYFAPASASAPSPVPDTTNPNSASLPSATLVLPEPAAAAPAPVPASTPVTPAPPSTAAAPPSPPRALALGAAPASPVQNAAAPLSTPVSAAVAAAVQANNIREWNAAAGASRPNDPPIFAMPQTGALYLQMGAVDKGMAVVLAEGLRRHGFPSFVAPGPSEKIFRVLIGPFAKQEDFKRAKAEVDAIDLGTFARRFEK